MPAKRTAGKAKTKQVFGQLRDPSKMLRAGLYARVSTRRSRTYPSIYRQYGARKRQPTRNGRNYCAWRSNPWQVDRSRQAGQVEVQVRWRSGTITSLSVKRAAPGERSLKTPEEAISRIHKMAPRRTYAEIAIALNRAGLRSAFGRRFTSQHVGYICRRDGLDRREQRSGSKMHDSPGAGGPAES